MPPPPRLIRESRLHYVSDFRWNWGKRGRLIKLGHSGGEKELGDNIKPGDLVPDQEEEKEEEEEKKSPGGGGMGMIMRRVLFSSLPDGRALP